MRRPAPDASGSGGWEGGGGSCVGASCGGVSCAAASGAPQTRSRNESSAAVISFIRRRLERGFDAIGVVVHLSGVVVLRPRPEEAAQPVLVPPRHDVHMEV